MKKERNVKKKLRAAIVTLMALILLAASAYAVLLSFDMLDETLDMIPFLHLEKKEDIEPVSSADSASVHDPEDDISWIGMQRGHICADSVDMLDLPDSNAAVIGTAKRGDAVVIIEREGRLLRVRDFSDTGWVDIDAVETDGELTEYSMQSEPEILDLSGTDSQKALDSVCEAYGCVGVTAAVIKGGEVRYTYEYGFANKKNKEPMTADTKVRIASVSKVAVGMTALAMKEQGLVAFDTDVSHYLGYTVRNPRYSDTPITLRDLLTHTSSIKEIQLDADNPASLREKLAKNSSYSDGRPGKANTFSYCNAGINTAAAALETVSGETLVDYTDKYFFDTLGIDASFYAKNIKDTDKIATLYSTSGVKQSVKDLLSRPYYKTPGDNFTMYAGGLIISAQDMARMLCILINDGTYHNVYYLSPESVDEMEERIYNIAEYDQCIVLKHRDDHLDSRDLYYHTGNAYGVLSFVAYDVSTGDGVVVITTGSNTVEKSKGVYLPCKHIAEYVFSELLNKE